MEEPFEPVVEAGVPPTGMTRQPIALALGAGGARGLAQIGVIEVLEERGFEIAATSGSSSGALVGGIHAAGKLREFDDSIQRMARRDFVRLLDPGWRGTGLLRGVRMVDAMREVVGDPRIEDLAIDFTAVAVDLHSQREVWLQHGPLWDALRASFAIPGLFTPHTVNGRVLVDGGLLAPLPIAATRMSNAHRLVAVDMHGRPRQAAAEAAAGEPRPRTLRLPAIMSRSLETMQAQIARVQLAMDPPDMVIRIPRDVCQVHEFWRAAELIDIGRAEATRALDAAGY